jgi:periplasmic protein TonB
MAFADLDQKATLNPAGLGAALAINAGVFAALLLIAPNVLGPKATDNGRINVRMLHTPKPVPKTDPEVPPKAKRDIDAVTPTPQPPPPSGARTRTDLETGPVSSFAGGEIEDSLPPPDPDPPLAPTPEPSSAPIVPPVLVPAVVHPGYVSALQPPYPPGRQRAEEGGFATVSVSIGVNGRVTSVAIRAASHPDFAEATRKQALAKWRFKPATKDGVAVESTREMTVRFVMPSY